MEEYEVDFFGGDAVTCNGFSNYLYAKVGNVPVVVGIDVDTCNNRLQGWSKIDNEMELFDVRFLEDIRVFADDIYFDEFTYPILKEKMTEEAMRLGLKESQLKFY